MVKSWNLGRGNEALQEKKGKTILGTHIGRPHGEGLGQNLERNQRVTKMIESQKLRSMVLNRQGASRMRCECLQYDFQASPVLKGPVAEEVGFCPTGRA